MEEGSGLESERGGRWSRRIGGKEGRTEDIHHNRTRCARHAHKRAGSNGAT